MATTVDEERADEHPGPSLLALAIVFVLLSLGSIGFTAIVTGGGHTPTPLDPGGPNTSFFTDYPRVVRFNAFLQLGAAIVLGLFTATSTSRLRFFGVKAAGVDIALFGGFGAALFAAFAALLQWVLASWGPLPFSGVPQALHLLLFASGGVAHVAAAGLLVAGVSVSAGLSGLLPKWLMWCGLVLAAFCELSTLTLIASGAFYFLPLLRFAAFVWMICVGALLPTSRTRAAELRVLPEELPLEEAPQS
jgi:hypothetical protein